MGTLHTGHPNILPSQTASLKSSCIVKKSTKSLPHLQTKITHLLDNIHQWLLLLFLSAVKFPELNKLTGVKSCAIKFEINKSIYSWILIFTVIVNFITCFKSCLHYLHYCKWHIWWFISLHHLETIANAYRETSVSYFTYNFMDSQTNLTQYNKVIHRNAHNANIF